jgi:hypothetical protein
MIFQLLTVCLVISIAASVFADDRTVFGPEIFTINKFHVNLSNRTFRVDSPCDAVITIRKNTPDMNITGGFLIFNWRILPLTDFLKGNDLTFHADVAVKSLNALTIFLSGQPGASAQVQISKKGDILPPPEIDFNSETDTIIAGESTLLTWITGNATSCRIEPGIGNVDLNGSMDVSPQETTTYTLTATGPGGTKTADLEITVVFPPTVRIHVSPETIPAGGEATLSWTSEHAESVMIDNEIGAVTPDGSVAVSPGQTTTYTITASGTGGTATASATVSIAHPEPSVTLQALPVEITAGQSAELSWTSSHADSATLDQGIGTVPVNGSISVSPSSTTTYTLTVSGPGGSRTASQTIAVRHLPEIQISASPDIIQKGQSTQISWSSAYADTVTIQPGIGLVAQSGSITIAPETTTRYTITASGPGGTATAVTAITVICLPPLIEFSASPQTLPVGQSTVLTWNIAHADTCEIQPDIGKVDSIGSVTVTPGNTITYTLTATGTGGTSSADIPIMVNQPPVIVLEKPDQMNMATDASCLITWNDSDAEDNAGISLYYDTDNQGADGTLIVSGIKEDYDDKTDDAYVWDTLDIPSGNYFIYAVIDDSVNAPVVDYAEGTVTIAHPSSIPDATLTAGDADAEDYFGESVAILGNMALIGASGDDENGVDAGSVYLFQKDKTVWREISKIQPDDISAGDHFGASIAMDGEFAAVGAYGKDSNTGAVYIFQNDGENWIQKAKLMATDGMSSDYFGVSLSLRNGFVIIGAYGRNISGPNTGAAYIFQNDGDNWVQVAGLTAENGAAGDYFGGSVAIFGNYALVGAPGTDQSGEDSGKVYVYQYDGQRWILNAELDAPDGAAGGYFGTSVTLNQEFLAIGATGAKTTNEAISGAVYTFYNDGNQWVQSARITAGIPVNNGMDAAFQNRPLAMNRLMADMTPWYHIPFTDRFGGHIIMDEKILAIRIMREYGASRIKIVRPIIEDPENPDDTPGWEPVVIISSNEMEEDDGFGETMDMDNGNLIIGSPKKDSVHKDTGEVNIYTVPVHHKFQEVKLTAGYAETELDKFGESMAADGNRLIIGAPDDPNSGLYSGAAHIFVKNNGNWIRETTLTAGDAAYQDYFGVSVDIEGDFAIVGAFLKKFSGVEAGAAYIFQNIAGTWTQTARFYGDEPAEEAWFGASVSISNGFAVVGAPNENMGTGAAYIFHYNGTTWERFKKLQKDRELSAVGDFFADSVSLDRNRLIIGIPGENQGRGAIQFFYFDGTDWIQQTKIDGFGNDYFGEAVALYGDYAIAGMAGDDHDQGAYYIFQWDGTDWLKTAQLISGENFPESRFGTSVAINDKYAVVGSANKEPVSGSAFIYQNQGGSWGSIAKVAAGDTEMYHAFGSAVAISGESFAVGSFENFILDESGNSTEDLCGAVYVYSLSENTGDTDSSVSITASATIVLQGESATLNWKTQNISSCTIAPAIGTVDLEGSMKVYPDRTTTYTITGHGPEGNVEDSVTITVVANEIPTVTLNAAPLTFRSGETVTLSWESESAASCLINNNIGDVPLSGSMTVRPAGTTTYTITATGVNGTAEASATVALDQTPLVDLTASAATVEKGGTVTLRWRSINADSAFIQGIGGVPVNAGAVIALNKTSTFLITVTGPGGTATDSVTITVIEPVPTISIIAIPETIYLGESAALGWLSENADMVVMEPDFGEVILKGSRIVYPIETTTYTVTATGPGGTAGASITVEVQNPIELTITSPTIGETITRPDVLVEGTFHHVKGLETGIVVNGIPAMIYENRFVANHVPLMPGQETIRVVATDTRGITNTIDRNLNMDVSGHYITLRANPESGLSPLETSLTIDGTFSIPDSTITSSDPSAVEYLESNSDNYKIVVTGNGFYYLTATAQNPEGGTCSNTIAVLAQERQEFDAKLRAKWEGMKNGLRFGNIETAVGFIEKSKKEIYDYNFNLLKDHLSEIEAGMQDLTLVKAQDGIAEYVMKGEQGGRQYSFYVLFVKDSDGIWRISHF